MVSEVGVVKSVRHQLQQIQQTKLITVSDTKTQRVGRKPLIAMVSRVGVVKSARHKLQQIQHTKLNIINKSPDDVDVARSSLGGVVAVVVTP